MKEAAFIEMVEALVVWKNDENEAIHKPLMVLFALAYFEATQKTLMSFSDIKAPLTRLLTKLGPARKMYHPEYPFWRLNSSGFGKMVNVDSVPPDDRKIDPSSAVLIEHNVQAGFSDPAFNLLTVLPDIAVRIKRCLCKRLKLSDDAQMIWNAAIGGEIKNAFL